MRKVSSMTRLLHLGAAITAFVLGASLLMASPQTPSVGADESEQHDEVEIVPESAKDAKPTETRAAPRVAQLIVEQANQFREAENRSQLTVDQELAATAQKFAEYMARHHRYGHNADGQSPAERAVAQGYEYCIVRENIAYQFSSRELSATELAQRNSEGWEQSPEHRENLLDPDVLEIGVGVAQSADTGYFFAVQLLGRPKTEAIEFSLTNQSDTAIEYQVDGKQYDLKPRQIRTHTRCRPPKLVIQWPEESERESQTFRPTNGDQLAVFGSSPEDLSLRKAAANR